MSAKISSKVSKRGVLVSIFASNTKAIISQEYFSIKPILNDFFAMIEDNHKERPIASGYIVTRRLDISAVSHLEGSSISLQEVQPPSCSRTK